MATLTIRNVRAKTVRSLKSLALRHHRSMEQEVRELIEAQVGDRLSATAQIEKSWATQAKAPTAREIDSWIGVGRR